jgi:hypothetical protein
MKQKLHLFVIHQTATSLQRMDNLNPRTMWYLTLDESNRMKSAYFTIHVKHRFHILHFPHSTGLFTKPTGCHYTKYRFSPDIGHGRSLPSRIMTLHKPSWMACRGFYNGNTRGVAWGSLHNVQKWYRIWLYMQRRVIRPRTMTPTSLASLMVNCLYEIVK